MEYNLVVKKHYGENNMVLQERDGIPFLAFPMLEQCEGVRHGFSTRLGGVSTGELATMNLAVSRGDEPARVQENFQRIMGALDMPAERLVLAKQTHTTNVRVVTEADAGKGYDRERDYEDIDGLVTNVPNLPLVTFHADCIPLYFVDPVKRAIGLAHSGWRGTVAKMAAVMVQTMQEQFGSNPADLLAGVGPGICPDCYEVGPEVAEAFTRDWPADVCRKILTAKPNGKYLLDLKLANVACMEMAGIRPENIAIADACTNCNPELLFSHRASQGRRGTLAAFLCLC